MTIDEVISAFEKVQQEDPKTFYNAMGFGDGGMNILHPFVSGSYEFGLVAGAMYALNHFTNQQDMNEETISKILEVRRALNEQVVSLLYVEVETEEDAKELETLKGQIRGAVGRAEQLAESLIKQSLKG